MKITPGAACSLFILYDIQSEHYIQLRATTYPISNHESRPARSTKNMGITFQLRRCNTSFRFQNKKRMTRITSRASAEAVIKSSTGDSVAWMIRQNYY